MVLKEQLLTIISSIIFGCIFYILLLLNKKVLFRQSNIKKIISNILFIIDMTMIYFIIIKRINNGILTYYSYVFIILGIIIQKNIIKKIKTYKK